VFAQDSRLLLSDQNFPSPINNTETGVGDPGTFIGLVMRISDFTGSQAIIIDKVHTQSLRMNGKYSSRTVRRGAPLSAMSNIRR
jgi:hypothetical protein